jgi:hypothetical protein
MTVTFIDSPNSVIGKTEALDFTASSEVSAISVGFGAVRDEERVYRDGAFLRSYTRSTRVGNTYSIVRDGGWPANPQLYVDEAASAADLGIGSLLPTLYSPLAQWGLIGKSDFVLTDRSGNARDLTLAEPTNLAPDNTPGYVAPRNGGFRSSDAAFRITGELTVCLRAWWDGTINTGLLWFGEVGETQAANVLYQLTVDSTSRLKYLAESGAGVDISFAPNIYPAPGRWQFYCLRRDATGVVTLNLDDFQATSGALAVPDGGTTSTLRVGKEGNVSGSLSWLGAFADVNVWNVRLSDAQVANARSLMTGNTPAPVVGAYSAALYSPVAQYALDSAAPLVDRTGGLNLETMGAGAGLLQDIVPGKYVRIAATGYRSAFPSLSREMTITCRLFLVDNTWPDAYGRVFVYGGSGTGASRPVVVDTARRLFCYNEGVGAGYGLTVPEGRWTFVAVRRRADGKMLFNVDDTQQLTTAVAQPSGTASGQLHLCSDPLFTANDSAIADVSFWSVALSDAQVAEVRASMGMR